MLVLKQDLGININGVNPDHIDVKRITSHGFKQNYVECSIDDQKRKLLFEKLRKEYGAVQVELYPGLTKITTCTSILVSKLWLQFLRKRKHQKQIKTITSSRSPM